MTGIDSSWVGCVQYAVGRLERWGGVHVDLADSHADSVLADVLAVWSSQACLGRYRQIHENFLPTDAVERPEDLL